MSTPTDEQAWLVIGGLHHLNGTAAPGGDDPLVLAGPFEPMHQTWGDNTVTFAWSDLGDLPLYARREDGARTATAESTGAALFDRLLPGEALRRVATEVAGDQDTSWARPLVPLFYLTSRAGSTGQDVHVYSQIRFLAEDALFIRTTPESLDVAELTDLTWLGDARDRHAAAFLPLNNHQRYYRKCFPGRELEYKYTLVPPEADIWTLNALLYQRILDGELPGYIPEYRDEFQAWDYTNHLFQVTDPEPERGYVSFIPTTDGLNLVKRKWYAQDAFNRRESHTYGVTANPREFADWIANELHVIARPLPPFRRARYDVNFESVRTGHVYGIFFDTVSLIDVPAVQMQQCELEYLRSRIVLEPDPEEILAEMEELARWLEAFLTEQHLPAERGYYSKLSFLLDSVAARPELRTAVG